MSIDLTVCIYARNEEKHIEKCISSAKKLNAKKIILGDNCSTDKTVEIAKSLGIDIINVPEDIFPRIGYGGAYNYVANYADTTWVLNLLGDCYLANPHIINKIIMSGKSPYYWVKFYRPADGPGHYTKHFASIHGRLYEREKIEYRGLIHEDLCDILGSKPIRMPTLITDIHICHQNPELYFGNPDMSNPAYKNKIILDDYLLVKMVLNPELRFFVNYWWFQVHYEKHKKRIHENAKRIREVYPTFPEEEWEKRL